MQNTQLDTSTCQICTCMVILHSRAYFPIVLGRVQNIQCIFHKKSMNFIITTGTGKKGKLLLTIFSIMGTIGSIQHTKINKKNKDDLTECGNVWQWLKKHRLIHVVVCEESKGLLCQPHTCNCVTRMAKVAIRDAAKGLGRLK